MCLQSGVAESGPMVMPASRSVAVSCDLYSGRRM